MTDTATLQQRLAEAETALHKLLTGTKVVSVKTEAGETTYRSYVSDVANLRAYIAELRGQLGQTTGRRRGTRIGLL